MTLSKVEQAKRKARSERVQALFAKKCERRKRVAEEFRAKLLAELKLDGEPSASTQGLILTCCSAFTEIDELNERFLRGYASLKARTALGLARGQLQRGLRSLGVIDGDAEKPDDVQTELTRIEARLRQPESVDA